MSADGTLRQQLAEALRGELARGTAWYIPTGESLADALLPVVERWAEQRAAEIICEEAEDWEATERVGSFARRLRARADALSTRVSDDR